MKRKMIGAAAAYMSGLFFASFFTEGSDLLLLAVLFPVFFLIQKITGFHKKDIAAVILIFAAACSIGCLYNLLVYEKITDYAGTTGSFEGEILDVEYYDAGKASYTLDGKINNVQSAKIQFYGDAYDVLCGDEIKLDNCEFEIPEKSYLFDSEQYCKSRNIFLNIENCDSVSIIHTDSNKMKRAIYSYREDMISKFKLNLGVDNGAFLSGIVFGETTGLSSNDKTLMYRSGIGHILAVSGLHVSIVAALLMFLFGKLHLNKYISFLLMNCFVAIMIIIVKSPVSVLRAAIMLDFVYSARMFRHQYDTFNSLSAAVLVICIMNPYVVFNSGFLLSVCGTFGIGVFAPYMTQGMKTENILQKLLKSFVTMFYVMLSVLPLSMYFFDETSLVSPLTNVFIVPLCVIDMLIGILYVISGGLISMLSLSKPITELILFLTEKIGENEIAHFSCESKKLFEISVLCALLIVVVYMIFKNQRYTAISVSVAITVFIFSSSVYSYTEFEKFKVVFLGRGVNSTVVVTYKGRTDVFDLSGSYSSADYVRKYAVSNGISEIQTLILTNKINSQYAAYNEALQLIELDLIMVAEDNVNLPIVDEYDYNSGFVLSNEAYTIKCIENSLYIYFGNAEISIASIKYADKENSSDMNIYYGNISEGTKVICNGKNIYLDELPNDTLYKYSNINNFEIVVSSNDGNCTLRRL